MKPYRFISGEPEDGQLVIGVAYYMGYESEISRLAAFAQRHNELFETEYGFRPPPVFKPIGYLAKEE